ncbi:MAG: DUF1565 domain-containing protein [bacterium]|nr:DUF1565 domain-containing protein [bacterium]
MLRIFTIASVLVPALYLVRSEPAPTPTAAANELFVDPARGDDGDKGTKRKPLRTLSAALAKLSDPLTESVTIRLAAGEYKTTGGAGMPERSLELMHRMRPGADVRFVGPDGDEPAVLAWNGERRMIEVFEGSWRFERVQIGSFSKSQRRGVHVYGPAHVILKDVDVQLRSHSDAGIWADHGGRVTLRGRVRLNAHLHEKADDETFSGILATHHGVVAFDERDDASLELGNGNLSVRTYGLIKLGCSSARVTCWTKSNNLTINNGGRIDLHNTPTVLRAHKKNNTPIGLEHDGHILAEDAHIKIIGPNDSAIALQKASTLTCNDIELVGEFEYALWATSGSMFVGRFLTDVPKLDARTGAGIHVEKIDGKLVGDAVVRSGGVISLPDRVVR